MGTVEIDIAEVASAIHEEMLDANCVKVQIVAYRRTADAELLLDTGAAQLDVRKSGSFVHEDILADLNAIHVERAGNLGGIQVDLASYAGARKVTTANSALPLMTRSWSISISRMYSAPVTFDPLRIKLPAT